MADGKVYVGLAVAGGIKGALHEMLLHRRARAFGILMKQQHALWQLAIVESLLAEHVGHHSLVVALSNQFLDALAVVLSALLVERVIESEFLNLAEVFLLEIGGGYVVVGIEERKHVLEHTAGGARCRNELHDFAAFGFIGIPSIDVLFLLVLIRCHDAMPDAGCCLQSEEWETGFELFELDVDLLRSDTFLSDLL